MSNVRAATTRPVHHIWTLEGTVLQEINGHKVEETWGFSGLGLVLFKVRMIYSYFHLTQTYSFSVVTSLKITPLALKSWRQMMK